MATFESTEDYLTKANDLLINREFEACLQICEKGLRECGSRQPDEQNVIRKRKEALCIVAVQAFAETNRWMDTEQFFEFWYGGTTRLTPTLLKMSMLLYLKVGDFERADILATSWLENEGNLSSTSECKSVLEVYIMKVLCANHMYDKAQNIIDTSCILTEQEKEDLKRYTDSEHSKMIPDNPSEKGTQTADTSEKLKHSTNDGRSQYIIVLQRISSLVNRLVTRIRLCSQHPQFHFYIQQGIRALALIVFIYSLLFINGNTSVVSPRYGISQFWNAAVQAWKSLFFPYHLAPLQ